MKGLLLGSTFKVTVTLASIIGFVQESSANKVKVQDCHVCRVLKFKIRTRSKLNTKNVTVLGTECQICVRQKIATGNKVRIVCNNGRKGEVVCD